MAILKSKKALEHEQMVSFGGIRDHSGLTMDGAYDMRNFRILSDGTLEKRCGFFKRYGVSGSVRGIWQGAVSGRSYLFVVADSQVYRKGPSDDSLQAIYVLPTSSGTVNFICYRENLYLLDGKTILIFRSSTDNFTVAEGYTPLYGRNWHPTQLGEIHEPLNLIQNKIRIHYLNTVASSVFYLPFTTNEIHSLRIDGEATTLYSFTPGTSTFTIPTTLAKVSSVEVTCVPDPVFSQRNQVLRTAGAAVYRTPHRETLMCFGGANGYSVYRSVPVTDEMMDGCMMTVATADPLYIPQDSVFAVGSTAHPVRALCQRGEQMMVFNDEGVWAIQYPDENSDDAEIIPIPSGSGCTSQNGAVPCGESIVTVSADGIMQLGFAANSFDRCTQEVISDPIRNRLDHDFLSRAVLFLDTSRNELWVRDPRDEEGTVWIYALERKLWVRFDGIHANRFFSYRGLVGFSTDDGEICFFDEAMDTDGGEVFSADYQSHYLGLSNLVIPKRTMEFSLAAYTDGGSLTAFLKTERTQKSFVLTADKSDTPTFFRRRLSQGRFRFLQFRLTAVGAARCRIYSFALAANN